MTWEPEAREKFHKTFGDYRLIPERNKAGQTAHLIDLGDRKIRVLPDEAHSGQKRATVAKRALEGLGALTGVPVDLVETYLIGALSREGLEWEYVTDDPSDVSIEEWLDEWFGSRVHHAGQRDDLLSDLDADGWEIRRKEDA